MQEERQKGAGVWATDEEEEVAEAASAGGGGREVTFAQKQLCDSEAVINICSMQQGSLSFQPLHLSVLCLATLRHEEDLNAGAPPDRSRKEDRAGGGARVSAQNTLGLHARASCTPLSNPSCAPVWPGHGHHRGGEAYIRCTRASVSGTMPPGNGGSDD